MVQAEYKVMKWPLVVVADDRKAHSASQRKLLKNDGRAIYAEPRIRRAATAWGTFRGKVDPLSDPNPELSAVATLYKAEDARNVHPLRKHIT